MTTPQDALARALQVRAGPPKPIEEYEPAAFFAEYAEAIVAALAADGWSVMRMEDVERLRTELAEARALLELAKPYIAAAGPAPLWGPNGPTVGQVVTIAGTSMQTRWTGTHWELVR